jgi:hypothetical protein
VFGRAVAVALAVTAAVAGGDTGHASPTKSVLPKKGEIVRLAGSGVECTWITLRRGMPCIRCGLADPQHRPLAGTYIATLHNDGRVTIVAAWSGRTVFSRTTSSTAVTAQPQLAAGDSLHVPGTALSCSIVDAGGAAAICYRANEKGPLPNTYGFAVGRRVAIVMAYDANRRPTSAGAWGQRVR